jgi:hypothetical protein
MLSDMTHSPFAALFTPGTRFAGEDGRPLEISTRVVGELKVPTGRLVASDPLTTDFDLEGGAFSRQAPTGVFPVEVALAHFRPDSPEVVCARVRFGPADARAVRWEVAVGAGEAPGSSPGYGVDTGTGCFFDEAACAVVDEATSKTWLAALDKNRQNGWTWHIAEVGRANVIMFTSGGGDGIYTSYWGLDAEERIVELVTDFERLSAPIYEHLELPWPLPPGQAQHPFLQKHNVTLLVKKRLWRSPILYHWDPQWRSSIQLSDGPPLEKQTQSGDTFYTWKETPPGTRLVVTVYIGEKPLELL